MRYVISSFIFFICGCQLEKQPINHTYIPNKNYIPVDSVQICFDTIKVSDQLTPIYYDSTSIAFYDYISDKFFLYSRVNNGLLNSIDFKTSGINQRYNLKKVKEIIYNKKSDEVYCISTNNFLILSPSGQVKKYRPLKLNDGQNKYSIQRYEQSICYNSKYNLIFCAIHPDSIVQKPVFLNKSSILKLDPNTDEETIIPFSYPNSYKRGFYYGILGNIKLTTTDDNLICAFPLSNKIYKFDINRLPAVDSITLSQGEFKVDTNFEINEMKAPIDDNNNYLRANCIDNIYSCESTLYILFKRKLLDKNEESTYYTNFYTLQSIELNTKKLLFEYSYPFNVDYTTMNQLAFPISSTKTLTRRIEGKPSIKCTHLYVFDKIQ